MVQFCNKIFENFSSHRLQMFENRKPSSGCVWGPLFPAPPHSRPGQGRGQSTGLDPTPLPCHSQLPTAEVLTCLQGASVLFSHCPAILPQDSGVYIHVYYILLLGKWSRVAWAEACEGWGAPSPFRLEEVGDVARREVSVLGGQTGGPWNLPWPPWCSLSWPPSQGRLSFIY